MPLQVLAASLEIVRFVLFISGFSSAQISAPNCSSSWKWVCCCHLDLDLESTIYSEFPSLWPLPDLMAVAPSHSILSDKIHVRSQRTCCQHAVGAVSCLLVWFIFHSQAFMIVLSLLQRLPSGRCSRDTITLAQRVPTTLTFASAVPSDIRL